MFDLFRFIMLRPPEKKDAADTISMEPETNLTAQLRQDRASDSPRTRMRETADEFIHSDEFVSDASSLPHSRQFDELHSQILSLIEAPNGDGALQTLDDLVFNVFNAGASEVINATQIQEEFRRLYDSVLALKFGSAPVSPLDRLLLYIRLIDLIRRIAANDPALNEKAEIAGALNRSIALPVNLPPLPSSDELPINGQEDDSAQAERDREIAARYENLKEAFRFLLTLSPKDFASVDLNNSHFSPGNVTGAALAPEIRKTAPIREIQNAQTMIVADRAEANIRRLAFAQASGGSTSTLSAVAIRRLSDNARATVSELGVDFATTPLSVAVERISAEINSISPRATQAARLEASNVALVGNQFYPMTTIQGLQFGKSNPLDRFSRPRLPTTHGAVKPIGVGDLLVVRQKLIGYELGEVAYIENILKGESHKREVRRTETIEESMTTEQESVKEEERDLQTTERFEMRRESENTVSLDGRLKGNGNFLSPGYGGMVEFENNNDSELHGSQQLSERNASTYGKDVTSRATSKITERVRTQIIRRTTREFEEKTEHAFENKDGDEHVVGIYQWVDKIYQAQIYNYGKRLFYDVLIPEPAEFLIQALAKRLTEGQELQKPDSFTLNADQIDELNYASLAQKYGAVGIEPPPPLYKTISKSFAETDSSTQIIAKKDDIPFPGYKAIGYLWIARFARPLSQTNPEVIQIILGAAEATKNEGLHGETDSISVNLLGINVSHMIAGLVIYLERTEAAYRIWKAKAHAAITLAYQKQVAEYEERLANLRAAMRIGAMGQTSGMKREFEKVELKKGCISIFTGQSYDVFNAISFSEQIDPATSQKVFYPQPNLAVAETQGKYIRFFEQAFEWEQMIYQFYPYFWSRKEQWMRKGVFEDDDKQFEAFLRSGGARVLIPVRPGFENALFHFMETGEIWEGGDLPEMNSPTYVPLIEEIKASNKAPGTEVPYGDPWKFRLPSDLVKLRKDAELPSWNIQNGEGVPNG
jgi:hypothetical protein